MTAVRPHDRLDALTSLGCDLARPKTLAWAKTWIARHPIPKPALALVSGALWPGRHFASPWARSQRHCTRAKGLATSNACHHRSTFSEIDGASVRLAFHHIDAPPGATRRAAASGPVGGILTYRGRNNACSRRRLLSDVIVRTGGRAHFRADLPNVTAAPASPAQQFKRQKWHQNHRNQCDSFRFRNDIHAGIMPKKCKKINVGEAPCFC